MSNKTWLEQLFDIKEVLDKRFVQKKGIDMACKDKKKDDTTKPPKKGGK